ncbi:protein FAR1-RELATED SEQUENCE 5-like [Pyrus ussuriensis x Pyrus communis]|uniref:Protein FAR1-RELATED SEQUENCE 5-like n=1 Tax=Pyrus ussuriensis x Pyrus communis TaxID=2448454 RepID=A0A5N5F8A0_9ROSA|nr:protein FAR1-RELATED SEQUENCE 5-like [Pyrus ussuriensis x Pyrus communis]
MEIDEDITLGNFFWADAKSQCHYGLFGDVIVFDTTFNTNDYGMMFAPFLGVNNHSQTIVFGCAFLKNKKTKSFEWLFEEMLKAMSGEQLKVIIMEQDGAIAKAIGNKLPITFQQYSIWHISKKVNDKGWDIESKEEFKARWKMLLEERELFMFEKFQVEELKSLTCFLRKQFEHRNEALYGVLERATEVTKMKRLVVDTTLGYVKCSYKEMEFRGLPLGKHADNSSVSKTTQFSKKKTSNLINKVTLKVLDTKLNCLGGQGARSSQHELLKDLIQVKRKGTPKNIHRQYRAPIMVMLPGEMKLLTLSLIQCPPNAITLNLWVVIW